MMSAAQEQKKKPPLFFFQFAGFIQAASTIFMWIHALEFSLSPLSWHPKTLLGLHGDFFACYERCERNSQFMVSFRQSFGGRSGFRANLMSQ